VKLVLQVDEVLVVELGELDVPEDSADDEGTNGSSLWMRTAKLKGVDFEGISSIQKAIRRTSGLTIIFWRAWPAGGWTVLKTGGLALPWKTIKEREIPSWQRRS